MPRTTKVQTQSDLLYTAEALLAASIALEDDSETEEAALFQDQEAYDTDLAGDDISGILDLSALDWVAIAEAMSGDGSRGTYDQIVKSKDFFSVCLQAPDREFRHMFRIGRDMFDWLVATLAPNPIFHVYRGRPQRHIKYQLGCFLIRYGAIGSDTLGTAQKLSIGFGTVFLYCKRVRRALRELRTQYLGWPSSSRKVVIKTHIRNVSGFPKCLGAGDGSLINFDESPIHDGPQYMSRKKRFGTNMQATCDHEKRFTSFELGWPGSVPDVKIFKHSDLWMRRHSYFENGEYILVDKGYPSSPFTIRPFSEPEIAEASDRDKTRMRAFNIRLSSVRIVVEHAFGLLKGRFPSLRGLGPHKDIEDVYRTIEALLVLHNMAIDFGDRPNDEWRLDEDSDQDDRNGDEENIVSDVVGVAQVPAYETDNWLKEQGRAKRLALLDKLI